MREEQVRETRVQRLVRKRQLMAAVALIAMAVLVVPMVVLAVPPTADGPSKVAICHFDGHEYGSVFVTVGDESVDGDYVIVYGTEGPTATFCNSSGGEMIIVSVNALGGHRVQLTDRLAAYPDGWKG